jgi:hypothetical protein
MTVIGKNDLRPNTNSSFNIWHRYNALRESEPSVIFPDG